MITVNILRLSSYLNEKYNNSLFKYLKDIDYFDEICAFQYEHQLKLPCNNHHKNINISKIDNNFRFGTLVYFYGYRNN